MAMSLFRHTAKYVSSAFQQQLIKGTSVSFGTWRTSALFVSSAVHTSSSVRNIDSTDSTSKDDAKTEETWKEPIPVLRRRLMYQSRKRGMLENDLLLSTFACKYLHLLTEDQLHKYDAVLNNGGNEWDLYAWICGKKPVPEEYDTDVMVVLQDHVRNHRREDRSRMPDLRPENGES